MSNTKKMTVKEAYKLLDSASGEIYDQVFYDDSPYEFDKQDYEAFCMAVDALKEKCGSNDLISRRAAIDALSDGALVNYQAAGHNNGLVKAIDVIKGLPSAQPELIEETAYIRGFEQGRTQGMINANLQSTCNQLATDCISRQAAIELCDWYEHERSEVDSYFQEFAEEIKNLPSVQPYTEAEIQKMQDLEQAEIQKAFQLGREDALSEIIRCKDCKHRPLDSEDTQGSGIEFPDEICPCQCDDYWYNWRPDDDWFCADAERRIDE